MAAVAPPIPPSTARRRGKLVAWDTERGFGFIEPAETPEGMPEHFLKEHLLCHWSSFEGGLTSPSEGATVSFLASVPSSSSSFEAEVEAARCGGRGSGGHDGRSVLECLVAEEERRCARASAAEEDDTIRECMLAEHVRVVHELELSGEVVSWVSSDGVDGVGCIRLSDPAPVLGLRWAAGDTTPAEGTELVHDALATAVLHAACMQAKFGAACAKGAVETVSAERALRVTVPPP